MTCILAYVVFGFFLVRCTDPLQAIFQLLPCYAVGVNDVMHAFQVFGVCGLPVFLQQLQQPKPKNRRRQKNRGSDRHSAARPRAGRGARMLTAITSLPMTDQW